MQLVERHVILDDRFYDICHKSCNLKPFKTNVLSFQQVRIIPNATCYIVEIVYEKQEENLGLNEYNFISLDLGLNNYVSAISNVENSFIINGKIIKSFNHWFNKRKGMTEFQDSKGYYSWVLKTTTNSEGKEVLVGNYTTI
jgi:hypothetical protein